MKTNSLPIQRVFCELEHSWSEKNVAISFDAMPAHRELAFQVVLSGGARLKISVYKKGYRRQLVPY